MQINRLTKIRLKRRAFAKRLNTALNQKFGQRCKNLNPNNLAWGLVILGAIVECFWVSGLKYANTPLLYGLTALGIVVSFTTMVLALKVLEVSVAYSVFVGIGTAGVVASEIVIFGEPFSALKVSLIAILLTAVIALKSIANEEESDEVLVENLASDLGIDKALDSTLNATNPQNPQSKSDKHTRRRK